MQFALEIGLRHEIKESASALRQEMSGMKFEFLKWGSSDSPSRRLVYW